jgi:hypothetical protein
MLETLNFTKYKKEDLLPPFKFDSFKTGDQVPENSLGASAVLPIITNLYIIGPYHIKAAILKSPFVQVEISALVGAPVILFVFFTRMDDETAPPLMTEAIFMRPEAITAASITRKAVSTLLPGH